MPELPEVETTRLGLVPHLSAQTVCGVIVRQKRLRVPMPPRLRSKLSGCRIESLSRRGKYLLIHLSDGALLVHLGMSGSLFVVPADALPDKHCHLDVLLDNGMALRFRDPRRFGSVLWTAEDPYSLPQLARLGAEPLSKAFTADYLYSRAQGKKAAVKNFIMDARMVAGVGNVYANEALFGAGISPLRPAGCVSRERCRRLARALRLVLRQAIRQGGTTLKDFTNADGKPGYFQRTLKVYGREGLSCVRCQRPITRRVIGGRSSFYCRSCQV